VPNQPNDAEIACASAWRQASLNPATIAHRVVVGKDTAAFRLHDRSAMTAGFLSVGVDVLLVGPLPTRPSAS